MINYPCGLDALRVAASLQRKILPAVGRDGDKVTEDHCGWRDDGELES